MSTKKPPRSARKDPHRAREAERYESPIASREFILDTLAHDGPLTEDELARRVGIASHEREPFERRIAAMEREGQLLRNRKGALLAAEKIDLIAGRVEGHPDGYGFVVPDDGGPDLHLDPREMRKVLHRDRVMVREAGEDRRGRREAVIVEVIERANAKLVGRLRQDRNFLYVEASDRRISQDVFVAPEDAGGAKPGEVVVVQLTAQPDAHARPMGRVVEVLGNATDPGIEIEIALRKHDLPFEFSERAKSLAAGFPVVPAPQDHAGREDLRGLALVTIDGESAKDFDDAVYCEPLGGAGAKGGRTGFRLIVAIADVSHYVRHGDALDLEARERGNSVYFPRRVIPMLPERLSNGLCSLNPDVDRLCMACDMEISADGDIGKYRFYPAVMRSRARLTYTKVAGVIADPKSAVARDLGDLVPRLQLLYRLFQSLLRARARRGAIDFETVETEFVFDDEGRLKRIDRVERNDAHRVIEECMLAANVCASDFLSSRKHPALYRVHEGPTEEKLEALREFLREFGLHLQGGDKPKAKDYAKLLDSVRGRPDVQLLQTVLLRSLQQAVYSPQNVGHFGLAYEHYTHFTSPIRRYPDLLVHRAIKAVLAKQRYSPGDWDALGMHCSQTERRADDATREVSAWLKTYYMKDRVGEEFDGSVSAVTGFGIFVALDDFYVEGLVHISELGQDYFQFDAAKHQLLGERTRKRYRLADRVRVRVVRVDLERSRIDFVLADDDDASGGRRTRFLRTRSRDARS
ncbi:MAG TPA: ribonuclease R [Burkholderiales bacterium]|nr:ribonuclease R [Burkholderiales bacterium]